MQKVSRSIRMIAFLLALIMMTFAYTGVTLSRYVTAVSGSDFARVAIWGINSDKSVMDLFSSEYDLNGKLIMKSNDGDKLIGPGVGRSSAFTIINYEKNIAPEVAYQVKFDIDDSEIDDAIKNNKSIQWKLDDAEWGTWDNLKTNILSLSGNKNGVQVYGPGQFMDAFKNNEYHIISWRWLMDNNNNEEDTLIGNAALKGDLVAKVSVKITAEQIDGYGIGILEGNNQIVDLNNLAPAVFRSAAPKSEFKGVTVNNVTLSSDKYSVSEGSTVIALKEEYLKTLSSGEYVLNIVSESMTAIAKFSVIDTDEEVKDDNIIPEGGVYYVGVGYSNVGDYENAISVLEAGNSFPEIVNDGDVYVYEDYEYRYNYKGSIVWEEDVSLNGWGVRVLDNAKERYSKVLSSINGKDIVNMDYTFRDCSSLEISPVIPNSVISMKNIFDGCLNLREVQNVPDGVMYLNDAFAHCLNLMNVPAIPKDVINLSSTFINCASLNTVEINANPTYYDNALNGSNIIEIIGSTTLKDEILATKN